MIPVRELPMPNGWFMVAFSNELPVGGIQNARAFGRDFVVFRGESGEVGVLDAYCPHLGANLGVGGCVIEDSIRCPFHGWRWGTDGQCLEIPYSERLIRGARAKSWPTQEVNGMVLIWYHDKGEPPFYEVPAVPEFGDPDWTTDWVRYRWDLRSHPQEIMENAIDWPHFSFVHKMDAPSQQRSIFEEHKFTWIIDAPFTQNEYGENTALEIFGENYGLGFNYTRYNGQQKTLSIAALTPVEPGRLLFVNSVIGKKNGRPEQEVVNELKAQMEEQAKVVEQDFPIWENKVFQENPVLCKDDGPVHQFRDWARKFYSDPAQRAA